ncbi:hypothetical protein Dsin_019867 [Dipteronia sinensis]|uniref:AAA+ ATPase domain-containing protein n=1 Tax=Dipteronia sinensis TaxID=43782 RepID=A0AAE0A885_9ROSI|nr:hypothetical protein Dsin_019867 [Dipteronia sinensis]
MSASDSSVYELGKKVADKLLFATSTFTKRAFQVVAERIILKDAANERIVGMHSIFDRVWRSLGDKDVRVIGIYGMGGVGKTTLLKQISHKFFDVLNNFDVVIWVSVSIDPQLEKIQEEIGKKIGLFDQYSWRNGNLEDKASDIFRILIEKKFVLLMDDIWERVDLLKVGVPFPIPANGSKLIFTTRSIKICSLMEADMKFRVDCLADEKAWELFLSHVGYETLYSHPEIPEIARAIVKDCGGLPLALVEVGSALTNQKTSEYWIDAAEVFKRLTFSFPGMYYTFPVSKHGHDHSLEVEKSMHSVVDRIFSSLQLSYDSLQKEVFKSCLLYCSLFPSGYKIPKRDLIDYWIGEGFLDNRLGTQKRGHYMIDVLLNACLLEEEDDDYVTLHDMIRDMILWITNDIEVGRGGYYLVYTDAGLREAPETEEWEHVSRLSVMRNRIENLIHTAPVCPDLETLFLNSNYLKTIDSGFFRYTGSLKVLNLSNNPSLTELPSAISDLTSLQHLDLSRTGIQDLSTKLNKRVKLKCLNLEYTPGLSTIPPISNLSMLHVLRLLECGFLIEVSSDGAERLIEDLLCLKSLSMLSITLKSFQAVEKLLSSHKLQNCIQSLWLRSLHQAKSPEVALADLKHLKSLCISECINLEELRVDFGGEAQNIAESRCFHFLDEVNIDGCSKLRDLTWLILAPNLKRLKISECSAIEQIINVGKLGEFPEMMTNLIPFSKLKYLALRNLPNLISIYWRVLPFPDLKESDVVNCPMIQNLPPPHLNKVERCEIMEPISNHVKAD